jgi:hypothetical protein
MSIKQIVVQAYIYMISPFTRLSMCRCFRIRGRALVTLNRSRANLFPGQYGVRQYGVLAVRSTRHLSNLDTDNVSLGVINSFDNRPNNTVYPSKRFDRIFISGSPLNLQRSSTTVSSQQVKQHAYTGKPLKCSS